MKAAQTVRFLLKAHKPHTLRAKRIFGQTAAEKVSRATDRRSELGCRYPMRKDMSNFSSRYDIH